MPAEGPRKSHVRHRHRGRTAPPRRRGPPRRRTACHRRRLAGSTTPSPRPRGRPGRRRPRLGDARGARRRHAAGHPRRAPPAAKDATDPELGHRRRPRPRCRPARGRERWAATASTTCWPASCSSRPPPAGGAWTSQAWAGPAWIRGPPRPRRAASTGRPAPSSSSSLGARARRRRHDRRACATRCTASRSTPARAGASATSSSAAAACVAVEPRRPPRRRPLRPRRCRREARACSVGRRRRRSSPCRAAADDSGSSSSTGQAHPRHPRRRSRYTKDVLAAVHGATGIQVDDPAGRGDAGAVVNKAILTKGKPEGDVLFGVDNTLPVRGRRRRRLRARTRPGLGHRPGRVHGPRARPRGSRRSTTATCASTTTRPGSRRKGSAVADDPRRPAEPAYKDLLVVENPATSSPGLASCWPRSPSYGDDGWQRLLEEAAGQRREGRRRLGRRPTTASSRARRARATDPLVVSYASSPPAEVVYADPQPTEAPTGVADRRVLPPGRVRRRAAAAPSTRPRPAS